MNLRGSLPSERIKPFYGAEGTHQTTAQHALTGRFDIRTRVHREFLIYLVLFGVPYVTPFDFGLAYMSR